MEVEFRNKGVLVTGTTGIGRACALRFAAGGAGVVAIGIDPKGNAALADEARKQGLALDVFEADATDEAAVSKAIAQCVSAFGGLDIIVNAAAIHPYGTVVTTSAETFARCMAVNVGSIHISAKYGIPQMEKRGGGAIINISSVQGHACQQNVAAYVASKGAIHALTRAMALDHAAQKITVNSISPAPCARRFWSWPPAPLTVQTPISMRSSPASARPTPSAASANRRRSPNSPPSSLPLKAASSRARIC